ncbi:MAG: hypothetical protein KJ804_06285 [Proteobacteria bacterium]|nr:hypothetical protein [Pseudomonadota bacterium]MBU1057913.1 hypothetical protein [Pseudomonadota bacterium]
MEKLICFDTQWIKENERYGWVLILLLEPRGHLYSVLASYWSHFRHACHYRLAHWVVTWFPWLSCLLQLRNNRFIPLRRRVNVEGCRSQQ